MICVHSVHHAYILPKFGVALQVPLTLLGDIGFPTLSPALSMRFTPVFIGRNRCCEISSALSVRFDPKNFFKIFLPALDFFALF